MATGPAAAADGTAGDRLNPLVRRLSRRKLQRLASSLQILAASGLASSDATAGALAAALRSPPPSGSPGGRSAAVPAALLALQGPDREKVLGALDTLAAAGVEELSDVAAMAESLMCAAATASPEWAPPAEAPDEDPADCELHDDPDMAFEGSYRIADCTICAEMIAADTFDVHWANGRAPAVSQSTPSGTHVIETSRVCKGEDARGNKTINEYAVLRDLGRGSYGKVKLVVHLPTGEQRAIKIMRKSMLSRVHKGQDMASGASALDDALREVAIMKRLKHPNVIGLHEVIDDPECDKMYVIMDLAENGCIFRLDHDPPMAVDRIRDVVVGICQGLDYLHLHGIVHRDIKPDNILLDSMNEPRLTDFGVSQQTEAGDDQEIEDTQGTPAFLTPEQVAMQKVPGKMTDLWALGVTVYILCFGKLPYHGDNLQELSAAIVANNPSFDPCPDAQLRDLLQRFLERDLGRRLGCDQGVRDALTHPFLASSPHAALRDYAVDTKVTEEDKKGAVLTGYNIKLNFANTVGVMMKVRGAAAGFRGKLSGNLSREQDVQVLSTQGSPITASLVGSSADAPLPHSRQRPLSPDLGTSHGTGRCLTSVEQALGTCALEDEHIEEGSEGEDDDSDDSGGQASTGTSGRQFFVKSTLPSTGVFKKQWFTFTKTRSFMTEERAMEQDAGGTDIVALLTSAKDKGQKELALNCFKFEAFPPELFECVALQKLASQLNGLRRLSAQVSALSALTTLSLAHNELGELPREIGDLQALTQLDLSHNELHALPDSVGGLQGLQKLSLDYNRFTAFPECVTEIAGLRKCFLVANPSIAELPSSIGKWKKCELAVTNTPSVVMSWKKLIEGAGMEGVHVLWDKIYPDAVTDHIFLGSLRTTQNERVLRELGITRILTTGKGLKVIDPLPEGIEQLIISVDDNPDQKLVPFFEKCTEWLDECVQSDRRVLVHCFMGLSRSVTVVCAWLMQRQRMTFKEAISYVKLSRPAVNPNEGFRRQLIDYEEQLYGTRLSPDDIENRPNGPTVDRDPLPAPELSVSR
eukprot:TRINITY_DN55762_c0_g1_i1.p1 TRINITY_DN55762_c0_g1~~TRINITY_DN55762_c0_g1_i1.p1  ORF type:complete len:1039 (+),score=290.03 TRINITY_DN55762_c0_g1_i1:109-3225(+)